MFLHLSVILFTGGFATHTHTHTHTQTPPHHGRHPPPWADTHTPGQSHPCAVHAVIRSTSGRYASYWNAFLLLKFFILFLEISEGRVLTHRADTDWNEVGGAARDQPRVRRQTLQMHA